MAGSALELITRLPTLLILLTEFILVPKNLLKLEMSAIANVWHEFQNP